MRFARRVHQDRIALGLHSRQHHVDGAADGDHVKVDDAAPQLAFEVHHPAVLVDLRAQHAETLDVLVDGTRADIAAAGIAHFRLAAAPEQCAHQVIAGPHLLRILEGDGAGSDAARVDGHAVMLSVKLHLRAQMRKDALEHPYILNIRQVFDHADI